MSRKSKFWILALGLGLSTSLSTAALAHSAGALAQGTGGHASNAAVPTCTKVGIVSIQDAILNTNEGKKESEALKTRFGKRQSELRAQNEEVEKLKADLQKLSDKLSDEERATRVKTISDKQKTLQRNSEDFQAEVQQAEQEVLNRLGKKMLEVLEKYAKTNGYGVILDISTTTTPVLYAAPATNITKELVDAYNAEAPVAAPTSPAPKTKP
jgi:outer membrane protein